MWQFLTSLLGSEAGKAVLGGLASNAMSGGGGRGGYIHAGQNMPQIPDSGMAMGLQALQGNPAMQGLSQQMATSILGNSLQQQMPPGFAHRPDQAHNPVPPGLEERFSNSANPFSSGFNVKDAAGAGIGMGILRNIGRPSQYAQAGMQGGGIPQLNMPSMPNDNTFGNGMSLASGLINQSAGQRGAITPYMNPVLAALMRRANF